MISMISRTAFISKRGADWENVAFIHRKMKLTLSGKWVELRAMLNENYPNQRKKYCLFPLCYRLIYTCSISHYVLYDMTWNQSNDYLNGGKSATVVTVTSWGRIKRGNNMRENAIHTCIYRQRFHKRTQYSIC